MQKNGIFHRISINQISVKAIIIIWYTLLMVAIVALVMVFLLTVGRVTIQQDMQRRLLHGVDDNSRMINYTDDAIQVRNGFRYYINGVYCLVYDADLDRVAGEYPEGFEAEPTFSDGILRRVRSNNEDYYVYDSYVTLSNGRHAWVRGVSFTTATVTVATTVARVGAYVLPSIVAASAVGGFFITKVALKPIDTIRRVSDDISEGKDLSRRLNMTDVTIEAYSLAQSFDRMFERLERSFETEKQFTANASHELRTPTSVIISQCEYSMEHDTTKEEFGETLTVIKRQARRMNSLVSQLLGFARFEHGDKVLSFEMASMSEIVSAVCDDQQELNGGVHIETDVDADVEAQVDVAMMTRLVENLVSNACRFGSRFVKVGLYEQGGEVCLFVRDDGIGIAPEAQPKIWDRFWQAEPSRSDNKNGSNGLGLAMVKEICELHGGSMTLESALRQGSTFTLRMPAYRSVDTPRGEAGERAPKKIRRHKNKND